MGNIRPPPIVIAVVVMEVQTVNSASCKATAATRRGVQPSPPRSNLSVWSVCFLALLDHVRSSNGQSVRGRLGHVWLVGPGSQAGRRGRREGPPWMCPPLPRQVCSGGPYRQTDSSGFSLSMDGGGHGPGNRCGGGCFYTLGKKTKKMREKRKTAPAAAPKKPQK